MLGMYFDLCMIWELHEFQRNVCHLVYLDTLESVFAFQSHGGFVVFFSDQWLSWSQSVPDARQHRAMRLSLERVAAERRHGRGKLYIWAQT